MNNVKNTIVVKNYDPFTFILDFYGSDGAESVKLIADDESSESFTPLAMDFNSLCQSCGFEIGQNGLCQEKTTNDGG